MRFTKTEYFEIRKIKIKDNRIQIKFTDIRENGRDNLSYDCFEAAAPEFLEAWEGMKDSLLEICELEPLLDPDQRKDFLARLTISGVSISDGGGLVITGLLKLRGSNSPLVINTPHLPEEAEESQPALTQQQILRLEVLTEAAKDYLAGVRMQGNLFGVNAA